MCDDITLTGHFNVWAALLLTELAFQRPLLIWTLCIQQCIKMKIRTTSYAKTIYKRWARGAIFPTCCNSRSVIPQASPPRLLYIRLPVKGCPWNKAAGVRRSAQSAGMECSFLVQGSASGAKEAQRSFETIHTCPTILLPTTLHFHLAQPAFFVGSSFGSGLRARKTHHQMAGADSLSHSDLRMNCN